MTNAVLIERAELLTSASADLADYTQYLDSWMSDLLQSELQLKLLEVEGGGARAPVPHSWRRHWLWHGWFQAVDLWIRFAVDAADAWCMAIGERKWSANREVNDGV